MQDQEDLLYHLAFSCFLGIGPVTFQKLVAHFGSAKKAYTISEKQLSDILRRDIFEKFINYRRDFKPDKQLELFNKRGIHTIHQNHDYYPYQLKNISDPPICLYIKGNLKTICFEEPPQGDYFFGIVGTRRPTSYGMQITKKFTSDLCRAGFVIVSGMAMGVDAIAHKTAIDEGGKTVAVLGCGVDVVYPNVNKYLFNEIIKKGGIIVSEFPPGRTVLKGLFVARNRIVSGLSQGVCIIEGTNTSGSLITARFAAEQGKDVFAPPVPITSEMSQAPNLLIKQGAKFITSVSDILEEYQMKIVPAKEKDILINCDLEQKKILELIIQEPCSIDDIVNKTHLLITEILKTMSIFEINGIVEKNSEGKYQVRR
ncbi:DNA-protecting protein DprA [Candidatus Roizmanbacteria bacterium CG_4_10_14_0_8_um_filter_33_9]|uniref:DNA-protecting protein DprA n=1 Tax=Candidatus Roizmanbacteria bacterium CG_4_10_14_0_8_um_filter_33_9 TaxID=1974826 RepID=A0A2M7QHQ6_9BACT|nr:MAG: DNA-protecting protein DprA [Candidatus Roizmanbacteria bacterium CG_4_10_14_0_8_um_filter_33_9]